MHGLCFSLNAGLLGCCIYSSTADSSTFSTFKSEITCSAFSIRVSFVFPELVFSQQNSKWPCLMSSTPWPIKTWKKYQHWHIIMPDSERKFITKQICDLIIYYHAIPCTMESKSQRLLPRQVWQLIVTWQNHSHTFYPALYSRMSGALRGFYM